MTGKSGETDVGWDSSGCAVAISWLSMSTTEDSKAEWGVEVVSDTIVEVRGWYDSSGEPGGVDELGCSDGCDDRVS